MLSGAKQKNQMVELETPLGRDKLLLTSFTATEQLSLPFEIRIEALSEDENLDFASALGKNCCVRFQMSPTTPDPKRFFSGVLTEAQWVGRRAYGSAYDLILRPWLWLLTHTTDSRIFQKMSVIDIVQKVFTDAGFRDFQNDTKETYKKRDYCVQYRETHFDFVCRLMEEEGIYYYFKHTQSKHMLVMADGKSCHQPVPELPSVRFLPAGELRRDGEQTLSGWSSGRAFRTGKVMVNAFDFDKPSANLRHPQAQPGGYQHDSLEIYDYPVKYKQGEESDVGKKAALAMLLSRQSEDRRRNAQGDAPNLFPGGLTKVTHQLPDSEKKEYLVVAATHSYVGQSYYSGAGGGQDNSYAGSYLLQPSDRPYKAPLVTRRPLVSGPQTATVVGPSGEEIHTDKHGRIKVQFHWDRVGKRDENSSRWVRVAHVWAGKGWGGMHIPRIGMEVVVDFLEGDPDRPIVVGAVYNGTNTPPWQLPANKTQSGVKSRSTKDGSDALYNEFMFEDKKGSEFVRLHAEKDLNITVEDKETRVVKGKNKKDVEETSRSTLVEKGDEEHEVKTGDQFVKIGRDQQVTIKRDQKVKADRDIHIKADSSITLECGQSKITMKPMTITIETPNLSIDTKITKIEATAMIEEKSAVIKLN
jgi:type VI secretion system secreted protein VgrG